VKLGAILIKQNSKLCSILIGATLFTFACSSRAPQEFDQEKAAKAIADSETFKDCHTGINNWDACNGHIYTGRWQLIADHWGSPTGPLQSNSLKGNPVGYWLYKQKGYLQLSASSEMLSLSETGKTASRDWTHVTAPEKQADTTQGPFEIWDVPLAIKKLIGINGVVRGQMEVPVAEVRYTWRYTLTPLGAELFKNERIPSTGKGNREGWVTPGELTDIDLNKIYEGKAKFFFHDGAWRLQENCNQLDICRLQLSVAPSV
jgi:hypothetical protein